MGLVSREGRSSSSQRHYPFYEGVGRFAKEIIRQYILALSNKNIYSTTGARFHKGAIEASCSFEHNSATAKL